MSEALTFLTPLRTEHVSPGWKPVLEPFRVYSARMGAGGTLTQACFTRIAEELLAEIETQRAGVDALYLALHGAMAAEDEPDPEGHLLQEARAILGPDVPIVVSLDMHGTITKRMAPLLDGVAILHTYPHIDWFQMGERAASQILGILDGAQPCLAWAYLPLMLRGDELKTATGTFGTFIRYCQRLELRPDVLGAGIMLGHPFTDVPEQGAQIVVVTDGNRELAAQEVAGLADDFWAMRRHMQCTLYGLDDALAIAKQATGPVVFSDAADATSSGAPGDSNVILAALLQSDYAGEVLFPIRDAPAVQAAFRAGVGSTLTLPLGGTIDSRFTPIHVTVTVEQLSQGRYFGEDGRIKNAGPLAVLRSGTITIVAGSKPGPLCDYDLYFGLGQDPKRFDLIVVKLPHTPHYQYEAWAEHVITLDIPGAANPNVKQLGHRHVPRPIYPLDETMSFSPQVEICTGRGG